MEVNGRIKIYPKPLLYCFQQVSQFSRTKDARERGCKAGTEYVSQGEGLTTSTGEHPTSGLLPVHQMC